jgi:hypothetical protein
MFERAAQMHFGCNCKVGGGSQHNVNVGQSHGMGCALDAKHALTAAHCWTGVDDRYDWPIVLRPDGLFRCEIVFENAEADVMILRSVEPLPVNSKYLRQITHYPTISPAPISLGTEIGFVSRLSLHDSIEDVSTHTHFAHGFISMMLPSEKGNGMRFAVSGTVMQKGFSGSAVFLPDGSIVGVLVESLSFRANFHDEHAPIYILPMMVPILSLIDDFNRVLAG